MSLTRRIFLGAAGAALGGALGLGSTAAFAADDTIKVGILHSLSGTMAISETTLKDVVLMMVDETNKKGGVLGKKVEAVVVDPARTGRCSRKRRGASREGQGHGRLRLLDLGVAQVGAAGLRGAQRAAVLSGAVRGRGILAQRLLHRRRAQPAGDPRRRLSDEQRRRLGEALGARGTDYVYPRTTNKILEAYLKSKGVARRRHHDQLHAVRLSDWQTKSSKIKKFGSAGKKTAVVSTINGDANVPFYKELGNQGIKATDIPVVAFSVGEEELAGIDTKPLVGQLAAWNYSSRSTPLRTRPSSRSGMSSPRTPKRITNDPMEAHYIGFNMWVKAVEKAGTHRAGQGDRRDDRRRGANLTGGIADDAQPPHHQAGLYRRDPGRRPVQHRLADAGTVPSRGMVALSRRAPRI